MPKGSNITSSNRSPYLTVREKP